MACEYHKKEKMQTQEEDLENRKEINIIEDTITTGSIKDIDIPPLLKTVTLKDEQSAQIIISDIIKFILQWIPS